MWAHGTHITQPRGGSKGDRGAIWPLPMIYFYFSLSDQRSVMYVDDNNTPTPLWYFCQNFLGRKKKCRSSHPRYFLVMIYMFFIWISSLTKSPATPHVRNSVISWLLQRILTICWILHHNHKIVCVVNLWCNFVLNTEYGTVFLKSGHIPIVNLVIGNTFFFAVPVIGYKFPCGNRTVMLISLYVSFTALNMTGTD